MVRFTTQALKIGTIGLVTLLVVLGGARFFDYYRGKAALADAGQPVIFTVKKTDNVDSVASRLHAAGLIHFEAVFKARIRLVNRDVQVGTFKLRKGMSDKDIVDAITGDKSKAKTKNPDLAITIPEGWRTEQIAEKLQELGLNGGAQAFMDAVKKYPTDKYDFLAARQSTNPDNPLEGYLFPDTYNFKADDPPEDIIQKMLDNFGSKVTPAMRQRAQQMNLSINDVVTFASIVEREAANDKERPIIADVYENRYQQGMNLESDPTVQYAIGKRNNQWWTEPSAKDLTNTDSPYNTYKNGGLPPSPIANPGLRSISAVLTPGGTDYLFFVAKKDHSGHLFARNIDEQNQNIAFVKGQAAAPSADSDPFANGNPPKNQPAQGTTGGGGNGGNATSSNSAPGGSSGGANGSGGQPPIQPVDGQPSG